LKCCANEQKKKEKNGILLWREHTFWWNINGTTKPLINFSALKCAFLLLLLKILLQKNYCQSHSLRPVVHYCIFEMQKKNHL
jgi:hypothetical protein